MPPMGTWGVGPFDNHRAREIVDAVRTGTFDFDVFRETCADDDLDADAVSYTHLTLPTKRIV